VPLGYHVRNFRSTTKQEWS